MVYCLAEAEMELYRLGTWSDALRELCGAGRAELLGCPFVAQLANQAVGLGS